MDSFLYSIFSRQNLIIAILQLRRFAARKEIAHTGKRL